MVGLVLARRQEKQIKPFLIDGKWTKISMLIKYQLLNGALA